MTDHLRRHTMHVSDKEVMLLDRAVRAYAQILTIQAAVNTRTEADDTARVSSVIQGHRNCTCPTPDLPPEPTTGPRRIVPIEDRPIVRAKNHLPP